MSAMAQSARFDEDAIVSGVLEQTTSNWRGVPLLTPFRLADDLYSFRPTIRLPDDVDIPDFGYDDAPPVINEEEIDAEIQSRNASKSGRLIDCDRVAEKYVRGELVGDIFHEGDRISAIELSLWLEPTLAAPGWKEVAIAGSMAQRGDAIEGRLEFPADCVDWLAFENLVFKGTVTRLSYWQTEESGAVSAECDRDAVRVDLIKARRNAIYTSAKRTFFDALDGLLDFSVPAFLLKAEMRLLCQSELSRLVTVTGLSKELFREPVGNAKLDTERLALRRVRSGMAFASLALRHNLLITGEELDAAASAMFNVKVQDQMTFSEVARGLVLGPVVEDKVFEWLMGQSHKR